MDSRNMKENSNFKIVKVMKSMSKTRIYHLLLSIIFNNKYWRSQLDFLHFSIQHNNKAHHENKSNLNNALLLLLGLWSKKLWSWYTKAFFWSTLSCLHPLTIIICNTIQYNISYGTSNKPPTRNDEVHDIDCKSLSSLINWFCLVAWTTMY